MTYQNHKLGLVSVSFRQNTAHEILTAMKASGLQYIEWGSDVHAPYNDRQKLKEIAELQDKFGIICSSYGTYFRFMETPIETLKEHIEAAKILKTDVLRLWCGSKNASDMNDIEKEALINECKMAAKIAKQSGVTLCMECHKGTFTENCDDAVYLMESVNSENFKMYWQPFQWQSVEENIENAKKIAPYTKNIHVFNWENKNKFPLEDAIDTWKLYLEQFESPCALLLEFMPRGTIEELEKEASALKLIAGDL